MAPSKPLTVAVLGPTGQCGSCVVDELVLRGHNVVAISRNPPEKWKTAPPGTKGNYIAKPVDIHDTEKLTAAFSGGLDAVVVAYAPPLAKLSELYENGVEGHRLIKTALLKSDLEGEAIIIGGAGSLHYSTGSQLADQPGFSYSWWYDWPDVHLDYMNQRARDHNQRFLSRFIVGFKWARANIENPGWTSWIFRPFARLYLRWARGILMQRDTKSLITMSRVALTMWEGVTAKKWTFLSPPGLLRDKGIRTGSYELHLDEGNSGTDAAIEGGIYNEDMAVAIVDEVEKSNLVFKHWSCTGRIGLSKW
ncbi:hypothetical protein BFJ63_vAg17401 [Fusarium oxysporum f. sp. narcissi]|uniref:NAD-dependent epimerase/dehydratase domain-containing protein n=1 Tax=Fusarium oxysporum f. sp. narcissi TaxID=451672 RepID=A0A4Q2UZW4_FUSOX|nr:hypothetical protein BFJ63_vAg17401 [Fusarium oxysporum f. sp. narcissi]